MNNLKIQHDLFQFFLQYKLNGIIRFYNESKRLIANEVTYIDKKIDQDISEDDRRMLSIKKDEYLNWFREMLINNCFLMIHSHTEESLSITLRSFDAGKTSCHGSDIGRFKNPFQENHGLIICNFPKWNFLLDCSKIRHIILHANGNISLAREPDDVKQTCKRLGLDNIQIRNSQIVLQEIILQKFASAVADVTDWILKNIAKAKPPVS